MKMKMWSAIDRSQPMMGKRDSKMRRRLSLISAVTIGLMSLTGIVSVSTAGIASASNSTLKISGYTLAESDVSLPGHSQVAAVATCPTGDVVVGGGGYEVTQGLGTDLNSSYPSSDGTGWIVYINNTKAFTNTAVAVAICAASSSLANYSIQSGAVVSVPAEGEAQGVVTCPNDTVSLGGGADMESTGTQTYEAMNASAPLGTNGWRTYIGSAGADSTSGEAVAVCASEPKGWAQVSSAYVSNPAGAHTNVTERCPAGTKVLGGGLFNSSADPEVTIGLTTSLTPLNGWHGHENNASATDESVDSWAVCAKAVAVS